MDYPDAAAIIRKGDERERVRVTYNSVYSDQPQAFTGNLTETEDNRWIRVIDDDGSSYTLFGFGFKNYERGQMSKNGRLIGVFMSAESINH